MLAPRRPFRIACALLGAAVMAWGSLSNAQDAKTLFDEGVAALERGDLEVACPKLRQSYDLSQDLAPLRQLADCEAARGNHVEAVRLYDLFLAKVTQDEARASAQAARDKSVAQLPKSAPFEAPLPTKNAPPKEPGIKVEPRPDEPSDALWIGGWIAFSVGAGGVVGAAITGGLILQARDEALESCSNQEERTGCTNLEAAERGRDLFVPNALMWGVAIAGVGAAIPMLVVGDNQRKVQARVEPRVGGASVLVSF